MAKEAGAKLLVMHPGRKSFSADENDYYWALMPHILYDLSHEAQTRKMPLALELMEQKPCELVCSEQALAKVSAWKIPNLFFTLDLAHLNTWGDPCQIWQNLDRKKLLHIHLSDNSPEAMHLLLGQGAIDLTRLLALIKKDFNKRLILEGPSQGARPGDLAAEFEFVKKRL
jgi:sugar phosphate isomerase/epimerase